MKIYTSYFGKLKKIPDDFQPIAICAKPPVWFDGDNYRDIAPTYSILSEYKQKLDESLYTLRFNNEVLAKKDPKEVYRFFQEYAQERGKNGIVLLCYETSEKFCHRHLVAKWLEEKLRIEVNELDV